MSDDRQQPPTGEDDDLTRPLPPPTGERPEPTPADRTAPIDETMPIDRTAQADETRPIDRTAPADRTARLPVERSTPAPWSGRAEVRPPRPSEPAGEWYAEEQPGRRWWLPILWGILALLLAGLLGTALWVVLTAQDDGSGPDQTPSPSLTSAAPTSAAPTSAAPTSAAPSSPAATTGPAQVPVPPLAGLSQATAQRLLNRLGLGYRVEYRPSELPPGTVVGSEPGPGTLVSTDDEVLLIVSQATPSAGTTPTTPAAPTPTVTSTP
jgi:hypothetical protein